MMEASTGNLNPLD